MRQRLVRAHDHHSLIQCYKCGQYGHTMPSCQKRDPTCLRCAGKHMFFDCPHGRDHSELCCTNCHAADDGTDTSHAANDYVRCPQAQQRQTARQRQTVYDPQIYRPLLRVWWKGQFSKQQRENGRKPNAPPALDAAAIQDVNQSHTPGQSPLYATAAQRTGPNESPIGSTTTPAAQPASNVQPQTIGDVSATGGDTSLFGDTEDGGFSALDTDGNSALIATVLRGTTTTQKSRKGTLSSFYTK